MESKPIILGAEMAAAAAKERDRLASGPTAPSPLQGKTYDAEQDEYNLTRVVPSPLDTEIETVVEAWRVSGPDERESLRSSLSLDDNYTLIHFTKRMAVVALNHAPERPLELGLTALAMIDETRIDPRDALWALGLLSHAATRTPGAATLRDGAAALATPEMAQALRRSEGSSLADWGYREIRSSDGVGLIRSGGADYAPTIDLALVAERIAARVLAHVYVCEIEVATELPCVWFDSSQRRDADEMLQHARGSASIHGRLRSAAGDCTNQMFIVWLVEMPSAVNCADLVRKVGNGAGHVGRSVAAVASGRLFALFVAGSAQIGVAPYESASTLMELAERTRAVLREWSMNPNPTEPNL